MNKEEQYRKTTGCVQTTRREVMRRSVQGASVRVPSPLARLSSPLEKQRAELGATLVRYQHSPIWQALENQCVSMLWFPLNQAAFRCRRLLARGVLTPF